VSLVEHRSDALVRSLAQIAETDAHEGPVYAADEDALYFTSLPQHPGPRVAIRRLDIATGEVTTVRADANAANGMSLDREGRLVICEQGTHAEPARISRLGRATRDVETIVDEWRGLRFNSPNDVVVKSDGTIWFTDPSYGWLQGFKPEPQLGDYVYRYDPRTGNVSAVADSFDKPNGLAFSPDERTLYVGDSGANQAPGSFHPARPHHVLAFDVVDGKRLASQRLFAVTNPGFPDGLKVDADGRVYASSFAGVQIFDAGGHLLEEVELAGAVNFAFGGPERNVLYITTDTAVWAAVLQAKGA
jgi:gluconolactonase